MKPLLAFLKTTALGGLLILLPLLLLELVLVEVFQLVLALARPLLDLLPKTWAERIPTPVVASVVLILLASLFLGLLAQTAMGGRFGRWLERNTVGRIPLYGVLKGLSARMIQIGDESAFKPAMLVSSEGQRDFAYLMEDHGDGYATVLLPWAPTPFSGAVKIVRMDHVEVLDASLGDLSRVLSQWGVGARELVAGRKGS